MSDEDSPSPSPSSVPPPSEPPPDSPAEARASRESYDGKSASRRRRLEGVIPEIVRRAVEIGVEKAQEAPDNLKSFVGDMKLPKEIAHVVFQQIDDTKNGLFRVVAKEIRDFLEHTNFAGEMQKLLTTVQFEVNTTIRFTPNDGKNKDPKRDDGDEDENDEGESESRDREDSSEASSDQRQRLPKPEVKTAVHMTRDRERSSRSSRDRRRGG
jgi:hypothetical protein